MRYSLRRWQTERASCVPHRAHRASCVGENLSRGRRGGDCDNFLEIRLEGNRRLENIVFTISAGTREDVECGSFTAEIGVGMDVVRVLETPAVTTFCRASADPKQLKRLVANQQYSRLKMLQIIPERDFPCASKFVALGGCVVRCFFVCVRFASSASGPAPVLRFLVPFTLFDMAPTEPKYESIGSSPDMDERGPMEVHGQKVL